MQVVRSFFYFYFLSQLFKRGIVLKKQLQYLYISRLLFIFVIFFWKFFESQNRLIEVLAIFYLLRAIYMYTTPFNIRRMINTKAKVGEVN